VLSTNQKILLALVGAYLFRLAFGLSMNFWTIDELQTYLIGLKCYCTGTWPYFGPDVVGSETTYTNQIPGALEGLLIAIPLYILHIPEAPYIFLNLLSLFAIALFTWYCSRKIPALSPWFIFASLVVLPWNLHESTHIYNPSWCLFGSVIFFIGFLETVPGFRMGLFPLSLCNAFMGFALFWVMQFHMSWMYLAAFSALSLFLQWRQRPFSAGPALLFFTLGALPSFAFMVPTLVKYGIPQGHNGQGFASSFNFHNFTLAFTVLARYLSLACYELPRFLGTHEADRLGYLEGSIFSLGPGAFLWIVGLLQAVALLVFWFFKKHPLPDWPILRRLVAFNFLIIWASFWFTIKLPYAHIYYTCFPLVFLYSLYGWSRLADSPRWRAFAKVYLAAAFIFQITYAVRAYPQFSLYRDRPLVAQAIQEKNYHLLGERRENTYY
jgi:hypothetical protein